MTHGIIDAVQICGQCSSTNEVPLPSISGIWSQKCDMRRRHANSFSASSAHNGQLRAGRAALAGVKSRAWNERRGQEVGIGALDRRFGTALLLARPRTALLGTDPCTDEWRTVLANAKRFIVHLRADVASEIPRDHRELLSDHQHVQEAEHHGRVGALGR